MPRPSPASALDGKKDVIHFDRVERIRSPPAPGGRRAGDAQLDRAVPPRRRHPPGLVGLRGRAGRRAARATAKKVLAKVALGEDPQADRGRTPRQGPHQSQGHDRRVPVAEDATGADAHSHRGARYSPATTSSRCMGCGRQGHPQGRRRPVGGDRPRAQQHRAARARATLVRSSSGRCGRVWSKPIR